mgnify:CR=1 FL=1
MLAKFVQHVQHQRARLLVGQQGRDAVEQARVEAIGSRRMEGVGQNLTAMLDDRFHRGKFGEVSDRGMSIVEGLNGNERVVLAAGASPRFGAPKQRLLLPQAVPVYASPEPAARALVHEPGEGDAGARDRDREVQQQVAERRVVLRGLDDRLGVVGDRVVHRLVGGRDPGGARYALIILGVLNAVIFVLLGRGGVFRNMPGVTIDRETLHLRDRISPEVAEMVYYGFWFAPEREALQALIDESQRYVTGTVRLKLYKGNIITCGRKSKYSLYDDKIASMEGVKSWYNQSDATGFIRLNGLRLRARNLAQGGGHPLALYVFSRRNADRVLARRHVDVQRDARGQSDAGQSERAHG